MVFLLALLFIKHYFVDFVWQTDEMVASKGKFGEWKGIEHSLQQGLLTLLVFSLFVNFPLAVMLGAIDFVLHYLIDWTKMNYGNRDISNKLFWNHLGLDQLAHSLTYLGLLCLL